MQAITIAINAPPPSPFRYSPGDVRCAI
jgi:hypothetical protein